MESPKSIARAAGALILTATVTYMVGDRLAQSARGTTELLAGMGSSRTQVVVGALFQLAAAAANVSIGVVLFGLLRRLSEPVAIGYVATRILDGGGVALGAVLTLALGVLSQEATGAEAQAADLLLRLVLAGGRVVFSVTMVALGLGSIPFCLVLGRGRLVPRAMAILGTIGYVSLAGGSALELFGIDLHMLHYIPGGIFELVLPLWLFAKGFNLQSLDADGASDLAPNAAVR